MSTPTADPSDDSLEYFRTDDLQREIERRMGKRTRLALGTALVALVTAAAGLVPSISSWIEGQAAKARAEAALLECRQNVGELEAKQAETAETVARIGAVTETLKGASRGKR